MKIMGVLFMGFSELEFVPNHFIKENEISFVFNGTKSASWTVGDHKYGDMVEIREEWDCCYSAYTKMSFEAAVRRLWTRPSQGHWNRLLISGNTLLGCRGI